MEVSPLLQLIHNTIGEYVRWSNKPENIGAAESCAEWIERTILANPEVVFRAAGYKKHGPIKKGAYSVCCCEECGAVWSNRQEKNND